MELIKKIKNKEKELIKLAKEMFGESFNPVILHLTDTDLYKITMQQIVYHKFIKAKNVKFKFKCRTPDINLAQYVDEINKQLDWLCTLSYQDYEIDYIQSKNYLQQDFIDFLINFKLQRKYIKINALNDKEINIEVEGPWVNTIPFEIYVLAIVNELYFRNTQSDERFKEGKLKLQEKINQVKSFNNDKFKFSDFGSRRRYSRDWQENVVVELKNNLPLNFVGTSNVYLGMKYNLNTIGTMAHEYLQAMQALSPSLKDFQKYALEEWLDEYSGDLSIALTDVVGIDAFLNDFNKVLAKSYDGVRHDSGCPYEWSNKVLNHYKELNIDAKNKTLVYSDGLDFNKAIDLFNKFNQEANLFFGIGTNLTNDMGIKAINIVMKMIYCNDNPVAKLSDTVGKTMSDDIVYIEYLSKLFKIK